ncbi:uncharacterized protein LOC127522383 isoform X2 [Ctenopharyngodon idella]|uniref:uncharacterized protein LOC127522383 isoform X2 n=1 Tax=Ctenopharyngodon idella TaxID=7959 RepID=UPI00223012CA|nr:uncharacterized protein LOC127522383 isoform X2 [Ctenopharyngodon idella]
MELFIFIVFQLLMEVQSYKSPALKVSPDVIRESSSVKMICETPADVAVKQCYFYINREKENIKLSPSCELNLTGAEVLRWAAVKSPVSVDINCYYIIPENGIDKSSHSPAATVTVLDLPQAKLTASASVINETDTVRLSCENTEHLKMEMCYFNINGRESNSKQSSSCQLFLTGSEISIWSEGQSSSVRITCFYTVKKSKVQKPSPHSDPVTVTIQTTSTGETLTDKTSVPHSDHIHSEVVLVFTGVGLFLSGLMGFICLCHFDSSHRGSHRGELQLLPGGSNISVNFLSVLQKTWMNRFISSLVAPQKRKMVCT